MTTEHDKKYADLLTKLPGLVDASSQLDRRQRQHLQNCDVCQSELAGYSQLRSSFRALDAQVFDPPSTLVDNVLAAVRESEQRSLRGIVNGRNAAYASGLAMAAITIAVLIGRGKGGIRRAA